jgi:hypothetical protein
MLVGVGIVIRTRLRAGLSIHVGFICLTRLELAAQVARSSRNTRSENLMALILVADVPNSRVFILDVGCGDYLAVDWYDFESR